jgi:hypothetical protein
LLGDGLEQTSAFGEIDAGGASIVGIANALHETRSFNEASHRRDGLFRQPTTGREFAHSEAVLFEQRDEHGSVGRSYVAVALAPEPLGKELVPVL